MHSISILTILTAAVAAVSGQTVYLAGDSTMAKGGGGSGTDGWGQYLGQYLSLSVVNLGVAGRSARSYTEEGRFASLIKTVKSGDYVVIEFGHNDGSAGAVDNGRQSAVGTDYTTTATVKSANGTSFVIHSWPYYIQNAITSLKAKGAIPIVSSQTPNNGWTNGKISAGPRFVGYAQLVASRTEVTYVDHYAHVASRYNTLGESTVNTYFPNDHTHTSAAGANIVAQAFVKGLSCGGSALSKKLSTSGSKVSGSCQ